MLELCSRKVNMMMVIERLLVKVMVIVMMV